MRLYTQKEAAEKFSLSRRSLIRYEEDTMADKKRSHLNERWYVASGDGEYLIAGHNDPRIGVFVCDCENWDLDVDIYGNKWDIATPREIAQRIADDHNEVLTLRERIAKLEKLLEAQRSVEQHIDELYG